MPKSTQFPIFQRQTHSHGYDLVDDLYQHYRLVLPEIHHPTWPPLIFDLFSEIIKLAFCIFFRTSILHKFQSDLAHNTHRHHSKPHPFNRIPTLQLRAPLVAWTITDTTRQLTALDNSVEVISPSKLAAKAAKWIIEVGSFSLVRSFAQFYIFYWLSFCTIFENLRNLHSIIYCF